jgi:glycosyltransferase involved in cell wall biosynthesis
VPLFFNSPRNVSKNEALVVARLVPEKGIEDLLTAHALHRRRCAHPIDLTFVGIGPLASRLNGLPGVRSAGFLQPSDLRYEMATATGLVLVSREEPWGVAIHEGAAAGLPLIVSNVCGAIDTFVDATNGWIVRPRDIQGIANALDELATVTPTRWELMSRSSRTKALQITPRTWTEALLGIFRTAQGESLKESSIKNHRAD